MAFQHKPGTASLFKNESDNPKAPLYSGMGCCPYCEKEFRLAAWVRTDRDTGEKILDKNGNPSMSIKFSEPQQPKPSRSQPQGHSSHDDGELPF